MSPPIRPRSIEDDLAEIRASDASPAGRSIADDLADIRAREQAAAVARAQSATTIGGAGKQFATGAKQAGVRVLKGAVGLAEGATRGVAGLARMLLGDVVPADTDVAQQFRETQDYLSNVRREAEAEAGSPRSTAGTLSRIAGQFAAEVPMFAVGGAAAEGTPVVRGALDVAERAVGPLGRFAGRVIRGGAAGTVATAPIDVGAAAASPEDAVANQLGAVLRASDRPSFRAAGAVLERAGSSALGRVATELGFSSVANLLAEFGLQAGGRVFARLRGSRPSSEAAPAVDAAAEAAAPSSAPRALPPGQYEMPGRTVTDEMRDLARTKAAAARAAAERAARQGEPRALLPPSPEEVAGEAMARDITDGAATAADVAAYQRARDAGTFRGEDVGASIRPDESLSAFADRVLRRRRMMESAAPAEAPADALAAWDAMIAADKQGRTLARTEAGALKGNLSRVPVEDLGDELVRLGDSIGEDSAANVPRIYIGDNGVQGRVATEGSMRAAGRIASRGKAMDRIQAELRRRGLDPHEVLADAFDRFNAAQRSGAVAPELLLHPAVTGAEGAIVGAAADREHPVEGAAIGAGAGAGIGALARLALSDAVRRLPGKAATRERFGYVGEPTYLAGARTNPVPVSRQELERLAAIEAKASPRRGAPDLAPAFEAAQRETMSPVLRAEEAAGVGGGDSGGHSAAPPLPQDRRGAVDPRLLLHPTATALEGAAIGAGVDQEDRWGGAVRGGMVGLSFGVAGRAALTAMERRAAVRAAERSGLSPAAAEAYARSANNIDFDGAAALAQRRKERGGMGAVLTRWADQAADQWRPIDRFSRRAVQRGLPFERSPEAALALVQNSNDTVSRALLDHPAMAAGGGILDPITREPMGPTLESVVAPLGRNPEHVRQAFTYAVEKRVLGRGIEGVLGDEGRLADAAATVRALGQVPRNVAFERRLRQYVEAMGQYAVRSGLWTRAQWDAMQASDLLYIPFKRLMSHIEQPAAAGGATRRMANVGPGVQRFVGSKRLLANPVEALAQYTSSIIRRADAYRVGSSVIDAVHEAFPGAEGAAIMTRLESADPVVRAYNAARVKSRLAEAGLTPAEVGAISDLAEPIIDPHNPVVWRNGPEGRPEYYLMHQPDLYAALAATRADDPLGKSALMTMLRTARRLATVTATGINPRFALGLNVARDLPQMLMQNRGVTPADIAAGFVDAAKSITGSSEFADALARHGLGSASIYAHNIDPAAVARRIAPVTTGQFWRGRMAGLAAAPLEAAERVGAASDLVGRFPASRAAMRAERAAGGSERAALARGAVTGLRATVNFGRKAGRPAGLGVLLQGLEQTVPFFGASVRSVARTAEAAQEVPGRVAGMATLVGLATMAEWAYQQRQGTRARDVDRPPTERARFLQFGRYRYPLNPEMALVAAGIRSGIAQFTRDDPDAADQLAEATYNLLPPVASEFAERDWAAMMVPWPGARQILEASRNRTAYGQRPVVPERMQRDLPAERRYDTTAPTFDLLASAARAAGFDQASPLQAEQVARGFLNNFTPVATAALDPLATRLMGREAKPAIPAPVSAAPLNPASAFVVRDPPTRTSSEAWYYRKADEADQVHQLLRHAEADFGAAPDETSRSAVIARTRAALGGREALARPDVRQGLQTTGEVLRQLRDAEQVVRGRVAARQMDAVEARRALDLLAARRQDILRQARALLIGMGVPAR